MAVVGSLVETSRDGDGAADFEWRIEGFPQLIRQNDLWSPAYYFAGMEWRFYVGEINRGNDKICSTEIGFYKVCAGPPVPLRYWLAFRRADQGEEVIECGREDSRSYVKRPWLKSQELDRRLKVLAPSDVLTVIARLRTGPKTENEMRRLEPKKDDASGPIDGIDHFSETDVEDTILLREHFKKLLLSADDHDVLLKVKNKEFRAHKSVLRARSQVFDAMFKYETKERAENIVVIDDCDPDCFGEFLQYLYTGKVENLTPSSALGLHFASDKYDLPLLKRRCVDMLKTSLSISKVCDIITLAVTHDEEDLLEITMAYVAEHLEEVMESVEWQRYLISNPIQANEVSLSAVKRRRVSQIQK